MGYGAGAFLVAIGLILALGVRDAVDGVALGTIGWILAAVGLGTLILTAVTLNRRSGGETVQTTTHPDGSVTERRTSTRHDA